MAGTERDKKIGLNVARLRSDKSQQFVADAMRECGHRWSQSTVWSVEKGDRPLKFTEAVDLTKVLGGAPLGALQSEPEDLDHAFRLATAVRLYRAALVKVHESIGDVSGEYGNLWHCIQEARESGIRPDPNGRDGSPERQLAHAEMVYEVQTLTQTVNDALGFAQDAGGHDGEHPEAP
ncbi:hypothetical protein [Mariniluteicoccus flavus]